MLRIKFSFSIYFYLCPFKLFFDLNLFAVILAILLIILVAILIDFAFEAQKSCRVEECRLHILFVISALILS